jgi:hypothetical protein
MGAAGFEPATLGLKVPSLPPIQPEWGVVTAVSGASTGTGCSHVQPARRPHKNPHTSSPLPRGETPIKKRNAKRGGSRFPKRRDPAYCAWIRTLPCLLVGESPFAGARITCAGRVECAHVRTRGAAGDDRGNTVPLCTRHHRQQHDAGIKSFELFYGLNLEWRADALLLTYRAAHPGAPTP